MTGILALLRLLPTVHRWLPWAFALGVLVAAALPIAIAVLTGLLVGSVPAAVTGGVESTAGRTSLGLLTGVAALVVAQRVLAPVNEAMARVLGRQVERYLRERVMAALGRPVGITHLNDPEVLAQLRIARGLGVDTNRPDLAVEALASVLPRWVQAVGAAAILLTFHWWLGLAWLVLWPVVIFWMQREYVRVGQVGYGLSGALRRAEYLRDLALTPAAAKELRIWGLVEWLVGRFTQAWRAAIEPLWRARRPRASIVFGTSGAVLVINLLSYGVLAYAAIRGDLSLAAVAVYTQALAGVNTYAAFDDQNAYLSYAAVSVPKMLQLDQRLDAGAPTGARELPRAAPGQQIQFSGVRFRYPGADRDTLPGLDLSITAGQSLAIVGANGAGKTSLVKLLCRLYEPAAGAITVDGTDLAEIDPVAWRRQLGVLFQDFRRYHLSAAENIGWGAVGHAGDQRLLAEAADQAGARELVESLPAGWDTILSREYPGGVDLSGGQWQRIALARAMFAVAAGARVLVLDEPTAALDVRAEAALYDTFLALTEGLTTILISHRFSTVRRADRIVVLDRGQVIEDGDHDTLLAAGGRYAEMFTLQAAQFTSERTPHA